MTYPKCNVAEINRVAEEFGTRGLVRGHISVFEGFGQPGCWQDAACLYGIENLIMATFEDPE
jgi:uroporphyrinogen decarboxylase